MNEKDDDNSTRDDIEYSRQTYYELIEKGKESLDLMIEVAKESEHPRAFEVLSNMIKHISDVNDKLVDVQKKKRDLFLIDKRDSNGNKLTQNNIFVGSTSELQKMLHQTDNETPIDVTPEILKDNAD